ncbi:HAD-IIB family hydrolase [Diaphorobacter sp.]|uniref:HAD-IIB family hydrolase n=1 Tax=Diaphorobacter sp. TaxID=1934310 RepID=UPI0025829B69|nr:HAD-IIB family hydrolase [Diaphorobacter sp.]
MLDLTHWPLDAYARMVGVLTDVDDTLTTEGAITPDALHAMATLRAAGLHVIAITGRPAGWSEPFATTWPVDAIVAETGAVALLRTPKNTNKIGLQPNDGKREQLSKWYLQDAATRAANHARMQQVAQQILREVPGAQLARDSAGRETDIAIDHSEFTHLPPEGIAQVQDIMRAAGMTATVSSIHVNGWYGTHDKLVGTRWIVRELLGRHLDDEFDRWVFVGDSLNDQVMFQHFPHSVGVANVARFVPQLRHLPRYVTQGARGAGFAELARHLLAGREP